MIYEHIYFASTVKMFEVYYVLCAASAAVMGLGLLFMSADKHLVVYTSVGVQP